MSRMLIAWLKWFWRLSRTAKILMTAVEIVGLWLYGRASADECFLPETILDACSLALCFLLIGGLLFGGSSR